MPPNVIFEFSLSLFFDGAELDLAFALWDPNQHRPPATPHKQAAQPAGPESPPSSAASVSHPSPSGTNALIFLLVLAAAAATPRLRRRDEQIPQRAASAAHERLLVFHLAYRGLRAAPYATAEKAAEVVAAAPSGPATAAEAVPGASGVERRGHLLASSLNRCGSVDMAAALRFSVTFSLKSQQ
jgi:hypothetical protein